MASVSWGLHVNSYLIISNTDVSASKAATSYARTLVAIGPGQIVFQKKRTKFSIKDFPRGQVNGFADNLDFEKSKRETD